MLGIGLLGPAHQFQDFDVQFTRLMVVLVQLQYAFQQGNGFSGWLASTNKRQRSRTALGQSPLPSVPSPPVPSPRLFGLGAGSTPPRRSADGAIATNSALLWSRASAWSMRPCSTRSSANSSSASNRTCCSRCPRERQLVRVDGRPKLTFSVKEHGSAARRPAVLHV